MRRLDSLSVDELCEVNYTGRNNWDNSDMLNRCVSAANACLYGITEAAVLAAGYAPAVGFIHTGKPLSFVYDISDVFKFALYNGFC